MEPSSVQPPESRGTPAGHLNLREVSRALGKGLGGGSLPLLTWVAYEVRDSLTFLANFTPIWIVASIGIGSLVVISVTELITEKNRDNT